MKFATQLIKKIAMSRNNARPFVVCVEGNVGSGKTTFLNYFNKHNNVGVFAEPVDMWRSCSGYNLLELMYSDPKKWSFTFQSYVQLTMLQIHQKEIVQPVKLMERSVFSARYCFVEKMHRDGLMPPASVSVLDEWFKYIRSTKDIEVDLFVYLRTTPEVAYERILKRNRSEEKTVSLEYIKALHDIHEDWLHHKIIHECPAPVITLNANLDRSVIESEYNKYESHILNRIPIEANAF